MKWTIENEKLIIIDLAGNLSLERADEMKLKVKSILKEHSSLSNLNLVLNFENVTFLDSTGIGAIISIFKYLKENNGTLEITNANGIVQKVLTLTRLSDVITVNKKKCS